MNRGAAVSGRRAGALWLQDVHVLGALSGLAVLFAAATFPLWGDAWRVLCPLREITGIPCPTCYGTRAALALMAGDWREALRLNPLVSSAGLGILAYVPWSLATVLGGWPRPHLPAARVAKLAWLGAFLVLANWIYLIVMHV